MLNVHEIPRTVRFLPGLFLTGLQVFHRMDEMLRQPQFSQELEGYRSGGKGDAGPGAIGGAQPPSGDASNRQNPSPPATSDAGSFPSNPGIDVQ